MCLQRLVLLLSDSIRNVIVLITFNMTIGVTIDMTVSMGLTISRVSISNANLDWLRLQISMVEEVEEENKV